MMSDEYKEKISKSLSGRTLSCETKEKISISNKGRVFSIEHRRKLEQEGICGGMMMYVNSRKENVDTGQ